MSLLDNMPHAIDVNHVTSSRDEFIGTTPVDADFYVTEEPAFIQTAGSREVREFASRGIAVTHQVFLQRDPGLRLNDRVIARDGVLACPYAGKEFMVRSWDECTTGFGLAWVVSCEIYRQVNPT
jgi:hypothetical protein